MQDLLDSLQQTTAVIPDTGGKLLATLAIVVLLWVLRLVGVRLINRGVEEVRLRYRIRKGFTYAAVFVGAVAIGALWVDGVRSLATYFGLLSAGLAIALKDLVENVAGWVFIIWRRPFRVGERIQIAQIAGDVIDIRIFQFTVLEIGGWVDADQSTGRIVHVPCGTALREPLINYSRGFHFIWDELPVLITFESDWRKAKELLTQIVQEDAEELSAAAQQRVREAGERYMIIYETLTPIVYTRVQDSGVLLTMRYLSEPRRRRGTQQRIWEDVLDEFAKHDDIDFAYPTWRVYEESREGKRAPRPDTPR